MTTKMDQNIWVPILAHKLFDLIAILRSRADTVLRPWRRTSQVSVNGAGNLPL